MSGMSDSLGKNNFEETERLGNVFSRSCGKGTPDFASFGYENCALAAVMAGKYKDAVDYCKRCLNVSPDNAACYMHRGAALAYLGDKSGSLPSLPSSGLVTSINLSSCLISLFQL
jgi:tetratricopeptide (TPR) repeat protein